MRTWKRPDESADARNMAPSGYGDPSSLPVDVVRHAHGKGQGHFLFSARGKVELPPDQSLVVPLIIRAGGISVDLHLNLLDLGDGQGRIARAGPAFRAEDWSASLDIHSIDWNEPVDVKTIDIYDEMFRVTIQPDPDESMLLVRQFGFEPVLAGHVSDPAADEDRLERLKGLGYVR